MNKTEIIDKIKEGRYEIESYFTYPTGTVGSSYLHEQEITSWYTSKFTNDELLKEVFIAFEKAHKVLGIQSDNKTALKLMVEGITTPVYLSIYDNRFAVCTELFTGRGGKEIQMPKFYYEETK